MTKSISLVYSPTLDRARCWLLTRLRLPIFAHDNGTEVIRKIYSIAYIE